MMGLIRTTGIKAPQRWDAEEIKLRSFFETTKEEIH